MILASGCFDGLHAGHEAYLHAAAALKVREEPLIVAVAADAYIRETKRREPTHTVQQRLKAVLDVQGVTDATMHGWDGAADTILRLYPRLFVKGEDWRDHVPAVIAEACHYVGCEIVFVNSGITTHTSDVVSAHS